VALVRNTVDRDELHTVVNTEGLMTALSLGVGSKVNRVILAPELVPALGEAKERAQLAKQLVTQRALARRLVELLGKAASIVGNGWAVT
jgi:hypothetical protein